MKKSVIAIIVAVIIIVGGGIVLATHNSGKDNTPAMDMSPSKTSDTQSTAPTATNSVTIDNFAFSPANITVKKGTTVTWTNKDSTTHTVTETDSQTGPSSGDLPTGKSYSFTFNTAGTFKYDCSIHPDMLGTVTVTE